MRRYALIIILLASTAYAAKPFTVELHESNKAWWTDHTRLSMEIAIRCAIREKHPDQAPNKWLARNKRFLRHEVAWRMPVDRVTVVNAEKAARRYRDATAAIKVTSAEIDRALAAEAKAKKEGKEVVAFVVGTRQHKQAKLARYKREAADAKKMLGKGGVKVYGKDGNIEVCVIIADIDNAPKRNALMLFRGKIQHVGGAADGSRMEFALDGSCVAAD